MLKELKLENVALIEIIEINFEKGLNVFTGESGSGKSLILDSLNSLFGGTNIPLNHLIRPGSDQCLIEAKFQLTKESRDQLEENNFCINVDELKITRKSLKKNLKVFTNFYINDIPIKKSNLKKLGCFLIDFAGQNDTFIFNSQENLKKIIDGFGDNSLKSINQRVFNAFKEIDLLKKNIDLKVLKLEKYKENFFADKKILQILEEAELTHENEILELKSKQLKLSNNFELKDSLNKILFNLSDFNGNSNSASKLVSDSMKQLNKIIKYDQNINIFSEKLAEIYLALEQVIAETTTYLQLNDIEEEDLDKIQHRLFKLQNLEKSFSLELPKLIKKRNELRNITSFENMQQEIENIKKEFENKNNKFKNILSLQSSNRKNLAKKLEVLVTSTLKDLGLSNSTFKISFESTLPNSYGSDNVDFLFSANPDQSLSPISKVISGGEMSRFLLALKANISNLSGSLFFDEIDNGLSGKALLSLIELMKNFSQKKQILCITHNPLLAAVANSHYKVEKNIKNGVTFTSLNKLITKEQKQNELAELIGGGIQEANDYALTLINKAAA